MACPQWSGYNCKMTKSDCPYESQGDWHNWRNCKWYQANELFR